MGCLSREWGFCPVHKQAMSPNDFDRKSDALIHSALLLDMPGVSLDAMLPAHSPVPTYKFRGPFP